MVLGGGTRLVKSVLRSFSRRRSFLASFDRTTKVECCPQGRRDHDAIRLGGVWSRRWSSGTVEAEISRFDRVIPIEDASTPPSSWYTSPGIFDLELERVFERRWQAVGFAQQLQKPGDFITGQVGRVRYVVCRDEQGNLRAYHNVCRHHAAAVASGSGCASSFVCPYHGWTYGLDGRLQKATRLGGLRNFTARESGLIPLWVGTWGPFVLIKHRGDESQKGAISEPDSAEVQTQWLGSAAKSLAGSGIDPSLLHVGKREYTINCNWKVFCDNYLDGGYHVPHAHPGLASALNFKTYNTTLSEKVSIQTCGYAASSGDKRYRGSGEIGSNGAEDRKKKKGESASFVFVYPNFMINRYGPWMDTNMVLPISPTQCRVVIDWFLEPSFPHDETLVKDSIETSDTVQQEDIGLCESVQEGLRSPAYDVGRYAPKVEYAMHHFHILLHEDLFM